MQHRQPAQPPALAEAAGISPNLRPAPSMSVVEHSVAAALITCAADYSGEWQATNDPQRAFLEKLASLSQDLGLFAPNELKALATEDWKYFQSWLEKNGSQARGTEGANQIYMAAILDVAVKWLDAGTRTTVMCADTSYPAAKIKAGVSINEYGDHRFPHPVASLKTMENKDTVYITMLDRAPASDAELLLLGLALMNPEPGHLSPSGHRGLIVPMIKYERTSPMEWVLGMKLAPGNWPITHASQKTTFRMNETGAHVRDEVLMRKTRGFPPEPLRIDQPFILCMARAVPDQKALFPTFVGYFETDCWDDPAGY